MTSDEHTEKDSEAFAMLKLQLELEKIKVNISEVDTKRVEMELMMQQVHVTLSSHPDSDNATRSDDNSGNVDVRHLLPWMLKAAEFDCLSFYRRNATQCISPCAIIVCVWCLCVYAAFVDARKTV